MTAITSDSDIAQHKHIEEQIYNSATGAQSSFGGSGSTPSLGDVLAVGHDADGVLISNLGAPSDPDDAATKAYVDAHGAASPLSGATADAGATLGGKITFGDASSGVGGDARGDGGYTQSDRPGGYMLLRSGTAFYGGFELGIGTNQPSIKEDPSNGLGLRLMRRDTRIGNGDDVCTLTFDCFGANFVWDVAKLPTADPHVAGHVWISSGVLTVSAG